MKPPPAPRAEDAAAEPVLEGRLAGLQVWLDPMVRDRRVLELWPTRPEGDLPLARELAREWAALAPDHPLHASLPMADAEVDVVLLLEPPWGPAEADLWAAWLTEIRRVSATDGVLVVALTPVRRGAGDEADPLGALRASYASVAVVGEVSFLGVSFLLSKPAGPGGDLVDDMAIAGDLAGLVSGIRSRLAVCAPSADVAWLPRESVLVPVADPGYVARLRQLTAENDELRERILALEEQAAHLTETVAGLRRDAERHLGWLSGSDAAAEAAGHERDQALARARAAERALADGEALLRRRTMELAALQRELQSARGP